MHRALVGDLQQALALGFVERTVELDLALDSVDAAARGFAVFAVAGVDFGMLQAHANAIQRQALLARVHPQRHRRAGS